MAQKALSEAYTEHPIIWLDPSIYSAQHQEYRSMEHAIRAYNKEKQKIISCYERQLQRLLSQLSIALKQIEYLEEFRRQQNKNNHINDYNISTSSIKIEQLNRKIHIMNQEMVNIKNLYITKMDILSQQNSIEMNDLRKEIEEMAAHKKEVIHEDISSHFRFQSRSVFKDDMNIGKLRQVQEEYSVLQSQYEISISNNNRESDTVKELKKQLKAAQIQQKLLLKQQRNEAVLKAKKKIMVKEQKQIASAEFKLQLEEVQINKDLVINQLAAEYHSLADKKDSEQQMVDELQFKLNNMVKSHNTELAQLRDEYISRIHYHRKQIQEYLNKQIEKQTNLYDNNDDDDESDPSLASHSREESLMSQISQSADEIVTSLVIGIDEKLDDILTPAIGSDLGRGFSMIEDSISSTIVHNPKDTFTYLEYGITPRDTSGFVSNFVEDDVDDDDDDDDDDDEPEPLTASMAPLPSMRSNASLLFAKPLMNLISAEMSDAVTLCITNNTHQELAEQCIEYEDTMARYESEIAELRETVDKMLIKHEDQELEIKNLRDKNRKSKRKEFDWVTKEKEYKSLLAQYRELRENNAKLTLTYFTLQCEYDKLKRDYDFKSAMVMNYGDVQINLTNQMPIELQMTSSNDLLLSATSSQDAIDIHNTIPIDLLSHSSNEDDVDEVVGFMHHAATPAGDDYKQQHNKQQLSALSNHGYNMSYWGNNVAFQYSAKTKDELIEDVLKLREKLSEMTDTKFSILQSTKQEIDRLTSKVKMLEGNSAEENSNLIQQIQINEINYIHKKQRKSFGGGTIGIMDNDDHTYTVSRGNDLDTVAKQLASRQHQRAQSHASMQNTSYLSPTKNDEINDDDNTGHIKSLTVLHNITESDEIKII